MIDIQGAYISIMYIYIYIYNTLSFTNQQDIYKIAMVHTHIK